MNPSSTTARTTPSWPTPTGPLPPGTCVTQGPVGTAYIQGVNCRTLDLDGHRRRFVVYVPFEPQTSQPHPVVYMFHGASGDGEQFLKISGWPDQSDETGAISVFPTGERYRVLETGRLTTHWNSFGMENEIDTAETPLADDVAFVDAMTSDLREQLPVDDHRVYASGFSNGAAFAARLAVERSETFAAVAFSGGGLDTVHSATRAVPTYETVGTLDDRALEDTNPLLTELPLASLEILANPLLAERFDRALGTLGLDKNDVGAESREHSTTLRWPATGTGPNGALFTFGMLEGLGHRYPNGHNNPPNNFAAAPEFWEFFEAHPLP
jgi:poly(3-hydroxybutyrate) depolymerase